MKTSLPVDQAAAGWANRIILGDILEVGKTIPTGIANCIITSPPYWNLRDYGTGTWAGGDPACDHSVSSPASIASSSLSGGKGHSGHLHAPRGTVCKKCGAVRDDRQIGQEESPFEYVQVLAQVFSELMRILRDDGVLWLNLGDTYAANRSYQVGESKWKDVGNHSGSRIPEGLKPKDLIGLPWRVAFALQDTGWVLRNEIIWHKPNVKPESVEDRLVRDHETIFLFAKNSTRTLWYRAKDSREWSQNPDLTERIPGKTGKMVNRWKGFHYWFDADAIKVPYKGTSIARMDRGISGDHKNANGAPGQAYTEHRPDREDPDPDEMDFMRNMRTVWAVSTAGLKEAHYATFPPDLIRPMILAGCPQGGLVMDPFMGAGTVALEAVKLQRKYLGVELNEEDYAKIIDGRLHGVQAALLPEVAYG